MSIQLYVASVPVKAFIRVCCPTCYPSAQFALPLFTQTDGYQTVICNAAAARPGAAIWPQPSTTSSCTSSSETPSFVVARSEGTSRPSGDSAESLCVRLASSVAPRKSDIVIGSLSSVKLMSRTVFHPALCAAFTTLLIEEVRYIIRTVVRREYAMSKGHAILSRVASCAEKGIEAWPRNAQQESITGLTFVWGTRHGPHRIIIVQASCNTPSKLLHEIAELDPRGQLATLTWNLATAPEELQFIENCAAQVGAE